MLFDTNVDWLRAYPKCLKIKLCVRRKELFKLDYQKYGLWWEGGSPNINTILYPHLLCDYIFSVRAFPTGLCKLYKTLCLESKSLPIYAMKCPNWRRTLQNWLDTRISVFATLLLCSQYMYNGKAIYWFYQCLNLAI